MIAYALAIGFACAGNRPVLGGDEGTRIEPLQLAPKSARSSNDNVNYAGMTLRVVPVLPALTDGPTLFLKPLEPVPQALNPNPKMVSFRGTVYEVRATGFKGQCDPLFGLHPVGTVAPGALQQPLPRPQQLPPPTGQLPIPKQMPGPGPQQLPMPQQLPAPKPLPPTVTQPGVPTIPPLPAVPSAPPTVQPPPLPPLPPSEQSPRPPSSDTAPKRQPLTAGNAKEPVDPTRGVLLPPVFPDGTTYEEYQRRLKERDDAIPRSKGPLPDLPPAAEPPPPQPKPSPPVKWDALTTGRKK